MKEEKTGIQKNDDRKGKKGIFGKSLKNAVDRVFEWVLVYIKGSIGFIMIAERGVRCRM